MALSVVARNALEHNYIAIEEHVAGGQNMRSREILICLCVALGLAGTARAVTVPVVEIDSIDGATGTSLHGTSVSTGSSIHLASYHCLSGLPCRSDGGEGLLVAKIGATCKFSGGGSGTQEDGGSFFADSGGHCWYRANLNGDLRQWGITAGSLYDATIVGTGRPLTSDSILVNAVNAFSAVGIQTIHTGQVSILLHNTLTLNSGWSLTCDVPPVRDALYANYADLPGSIVLGHGAFLDATTNSDIEIHDCAAIIPEWYINPSSNIITWTGGISGFNSPATQYSDLEAIRANMIAAGDVGIKASTSAKIHDLSILGFDNCLYVLHSPDFLAKNIAMDCSVGAYLYNERGAMTIKDFDSDPRLTKLVGNPPFSNEEYWTVSAVTKNATTGECELTLNAVKGSEVDHSGVFQPLYSVKDLTVSGLNSALGLRGDPNYYPAWVAGLGLAGMSCLSSGTGQFGNDAAWAVHNITSRNIDTGNYLNDHATIDLVGSKYTTSSGAPTPISVDTTGDWVAGTGVLHITGPISNIAPGMTVTSSDASLSSATVTGIVQRCTGPDPNDGYNGCIIVSPAPTAAATAATLHFYSGADSIADSTACDGSGQTPCFFYNAAERYVAGPSDAGNASARLAASRGGNLGAGVLLDGISALRAINIFVYGHYYHTAAIDSADCDFAQIKGDDNGELNPGNIVGIYLTGSSRGCNFESHGPGKPAASIVQDTYGTSDYTGTASGQPIQVTVGGAGLNKSFTGSVTVTGGTLTNWPSRGTLHICEATMSSGGDTVCNANNNPPFNNEFVTYHRIDNTHFSIEVRGRFGTVPLDFTAFSTLTVYSTSINSGSDKHADKSSTSIFADLNDPTTTSVGNQFEILHGAATLQNVHTSASGIGFVSTNTAGVTIAGADQGDTTLVFEDDVARVLTTLSPDSVFGTYVKPGAINQPLSYFQFAGSPQSATGLNALGTNGIGTLTVQDTSNWPQTGVLTVDGEYLAFHVSDATHLIVEQRGVCGSMPATHADGMVAFMNVLYGCASSGQGLPQFSLDNAGNVAFAQSALAHGQVYMSFDSVSTNKNVLLCPFNGKGLIIGGVLRTVPHNCALAPTTTLSSAGLYYVYATYHQIAVTNVLQHTTYARLYVTNNTDFYAGTPITCYGITGPASSTVNVVEDSFTVPGTLMGGQAYIDITDATVGAIPSGTGACSYIGLELSASGHITANNGVEVKSGDTTQTLVGMVYSSNVVGSPGVHDTNSQRDVASWFNRRIKTCRVTWNATGTVASTTYAEVTASGTPLHCEFVSWDRSDTAWSLFGMVNNNATNTAWITGDFDGATVEAENAQWRQSIASGVQYPLGLSGSASLSENVHYLSTFAKGTTATTISVFQGSGEDVRLEQ